MLKKFIIAIGGFVLVVASLAAIKAAQLNEMMSAPHMQPASAVSTFEAKEVSWSPSLRAIGTLAPVNGVMISADADGTIVKIAAESGSSVKKGDLLVEIDSSVESANLNAALATAELSRVNRARASDLWALQAIAKSDYDAAEAAALQSLAAVTALEAKIAKKKVTAPFAGRVGIRTVNVGQFVGRGAALLPLQSLDPMYVNFSVPQRQIPSLYMGQKMKVSVDAFQDMEFAAMITAINSEVDSSTRNIYVQATLANPEEKLRSGMFVRFAVELPANDNIVVVPATAIAYASYGNSVYIVEEMEGEDGKKYLGVRQQFVTLGQTRGDLVSLMTGVKPGEEVVSAGVFKLRPGAHVQVNNSAQPSSNANPTPDNT